MKSLIVAMLSLSLVFFSKDKTVQKVNPAYFGEYYNTSKPDVKEWTLKPVAKAENKIAFYHNKETDFVFTVVMKDSTHFKSPGEFMQQADGQPTRYWSAKGEFLPDGSMKIAIRNSDAAVKLSMDMEGQPKETFIKK